MVRLFFISALVLILTPVVYGQTNYNDIKFVNSATGWICGDNGAILNTLDFGINWTTQISGISSNLNSIYFADENNGWVVGDDGVILHSSDGGANWSPQSSNTTRRLNSVFFVNPDTGWVAGRWGWILKTTDGGSNWVLQNSNTGSTLWSVYFVNDTIGWAVGNEGVVIHSSDGGVNWGTQNSGLPITLILFSVFFNDEDYGWAVGSDGTIIHTDDGGVTWVPQTSGQTRWLNSVFFTNNNTGWIAGNDGRILKTTDGGSTWSSQTVSSENLSSLYFINSNIGISVGDNEEILYTVDGGNNWSSGPIQPFIALTSPNGGEVLQIGETEEITWSSINISEIDIDYSVDNGNTWLSIATNIQANSGSYFWSVVGPPSTTCLVRISDSSNPTLLDASDQSFTIEENSLTAGLIAYYPFNGNANDESFNNNDGTIHGAVLTEDRFGNPNSAYLFDGIDDYIDIGNDSTLKPQLPVTLSCWVKDNGSGGPFFENNFHPTKYHGVWFAINLSNQPHMSYGDGGGIGDAWRRSKTGTTVLQTDIWYHLVGIIRGATDMDIYINGINDGGNYNGSGGNLQYDSGSGSIGRHDSNTSGPSTYFQGVLDDIRFYNRELSEAEILALYNEPHKDFTSTLSVSDNLGFTLDLVFGTASNATDGYDPDYDQYAPPPPPGGVFDARFRINNEDYLKDYRATNTDSIIWHVLYSPSAGGDPITLSWDNTYFPEGSFRLKDIPTNGGLVNVDMKSRSSFTDTLSLHNLKIVYSVLETSVAMDIVAPWSLLGLPLDVINPYYLSLFPDALENTLFAYDSTYFLEDSLIPGDGYWLRFPAADTVSITGFPIQTISLDLSQGWHLISGVSCNVSLADISDPSGIIIPGTIYGWNGAYFLADSLKPGKGYWMQTSAAGQITIDCSGSGQQLAKRWKQLLNLNKYPTLNIADASGAEQSLYFNIPVRDEKAKLNYSLPPLPPAGAFDARFEDNYRISENEEATILIQTSQYPVIINASNLQVNDGYKYAIMEILAGTQGKSYLLKNGANIEISNPNVKKLKLTTSESIPLMFEVTQNYPNPFNPTTTIKYVLPEDGKVDILIYNTLGQKVKTLVSENKEAGYYAIIWDATNDAGAKVSSGIFFYQVKAGKFTDVKKMVLMK